MKLHLGIQMSQHMGYQQVFKISSLYNDPKQYCVAAAVTNGSNPLSSAAKLVFQRILHPSHPF